VPLTAEEFAERFQESGRVLWTVAAGVLGGPSEAEDVLQEAALMALSKLDRFDRDTDFVAWTGRFVRNVALNHARKRGRRATGPVAPDRFAEIAEGGGGARGPGPSPAPRPAPVDGRGQLAPGQEAFDDLVVEGLRDLAADQRAALLLRTVHELSYREISAVLESPEGTAMSHVHRARHALRRHLEEHTIDVERRA
jgi:RNA polymerase sigma-70 factor (ECF subfamily)